MGVSLGGDVGWERKPSELSIGIEPWWGQWVMGKANLMA